MTVASIPDVLPLFPLPETVLFPHTLLPLHVFEPRYRQMVKAIQNGSGWLAIPLLNAEASRTAGGDVIHTLAGAGRLKECRELRDGRFQIVVEGRARVRLEEIEVDTLYRQARAIPAPESTDWIFGSEGEDLLADAWTLAEALHLLTDGEPRELLDQVSARPILINRLCMMVMATPAERQGLLAADDYQARLELLLHQLRLGLSLAESLARHPRPEHPGLN